MEKFEKFAQDVGKLVDEKQQAYGDSFGLCGEFLKLLWPNGVPVNQYSDLLCVVRIFDKLKRIATNKDAFGENPYQDIVGYGLLGMRSHEVSSKAPFNEFPLTEAQIDEICTNLEKNKTFSTTCPCSVKYK